jgi:hypothetical protein
VADNSPSAVNDQIAAFRAGFKKYFSRMTGQGDKGTSARGMPQVTPDSVPPRALSQIWTTHEARFPKTPVRIRDARELLAGEKRAPMPASFDKDDRRNFRADGSDKFERPRHTARRLAKKIIEIKRPNAGESNAAKKAATKIERFANGALSKKYPYRATVEILLNEGELFLFVTPAPSYWQFIPCLFDDTQEEGPHLTEQEYAAVPEQRQAEYEGFDTKVTDTPDPQAADDAAMLAASQGEQPTTANEPTTTTETRYKRLKRRYRVDAEGNTDDGSDAFTLDRTQSNALYKDDLKHQYGDKLPLVYELVHREDCIPINPRFSGDQIEIDGVIRRTLFSRSELIRRNYAWDGMDEQLEPVSARDGRDGEFWLYEYRTFDEQGRPFIVYQVGDAGYTTKDDETAVIKLWEEYECVDELLVHYDLGQHWSSANWDLNSIPFTRSFAGNWLQRDAVMTGLAISVWGSSFPSWGQKMTQEGLTLSKLMGDVPLDFNVESNTVKPLFGDLVEMTPKGTNMDVKTLLVGLDAINSEDLPQTGAFGGPGPTSGLDRQVQGRDTDDSLGDVTEASRRMAEAAARMTLKVCTSLARKTKRPVELMIMSTVTAAQGGEQTTNYSTVELGPDDCGPNFDVLAIFPNVPGENLAGAMAYKDLVAAGLLLREEFRELWGDPSPELFEAKLRLQRFYDSPEGQQDLMLGLAEYMADNRQKQLIQLAAAGKATPGGQPKALMDNLLGGAAPAAPATGGGGGGNPAQQSLAGTRGGVLQADAASAGGSMDGMTGQPLGRAA